MISPLEIKKKANYQFYAFLSSLITGDSFFPFDIKGDKKPNPDLVKFQAEITSLVESSKEKKGFGYHIEFRTINTRNRAIQDLPSSISFNTERDFLKYIEKEKVTRNFRKDASFIIDNFPELTKFIIHKPEKVVKQAGKWESLILVLNYFISSPKPNLYIRELPIAVHTKFIERNKGIIRELLDILLDEATLVLSKHFETRFGLKYAEPMIRFKILDSDISNKFFSGLDDMALPLSLFKKLNLNLSRIVIVENKVSLYNSLTIPNKTKTIAIFGKGYSVSNLKEIKWFKDTQILYWGDFDAHGFDILSQIRGYYEKVQSILMDRNTFDKFYEGETGKYLSKEELPNLLPAEQEVYKLLRTNNWRLEQEKIPRVHFIEAFSKF